MRRVGRDDLPNDQKIVQHPHCSEFLLNGRLGSGKIFNPGSHMERAYGFKLKAVSSTPIKKLPARASISLAGIPVTDRGSEKVDVGFCDFRTGCGDQLRDPRA